MDCVPLCTPSGGSVFPADSMGYRTEDMHTVVGWDYQDCVFHLDSGEVRTHGEVGFNSFLVPPKKNSPVPPIGRYATCAIAGDCRVQMVGSAGAIVQNATRNMAVALQVLTTIPVHDVTRIDSVHLLLPGNHGFAFSYVEASGGAMGLVDHLMHQMCCEFGASPVGDVQFYERVSSKGTLVALTQARSCRHLTIEVHGTINYPLPFNPCSDSIRYTTCISAVMHSATAHMMDMNPWLAGCPIQRAWARLGFPAGSVVPDGALIRAPWQLEGPDRRLTLASDVPALARDAVKLTAEVFVHGVRSARLTPRAGGKYTMKYDNGDHGEAICDVDMPDLARRLDELADQCVVIGEHDVRRKLPDCPDIMLLECFGSDYSSKTGMYSSH